MCLAVDVLLIDIEVGPRLLEGDPRRVRDLHLGRVRHLGFRSFAAIAVAPRQQQRADADRHSDRHVDTSRAPG
jgi:hypothetical protein